MYNLPQKEAFMADNQGFLLLKIVPLGFIFTE